MSKTIIHSKSIAELHKVKGLEEPNHPLITVIDASKLAFGKEALGLKFSSSLYCIALKDKISNFSYGRSHYDFDKGVLIFTAPNQVISITETQEIGEAQGWMLYFHPDLIRKSSLGNQLDDYSFFSYAINEALHLSKQEENSLTNCVKMIEEEINLRIDNHSQQVLVSNIELLLNYCKRYYERQFNTRTTQNKDVVYKVKNLLKEYYNSDKLIENGQPTVSYFAEKCFISPGYLSDLLRKETGNTAKNFINEFVIEKAKNELLGTNESISEIAYKLGFNHPHYFSRLFKSKTGKTPVEYRNN